MIINRNGKSHFKKLFPAGSVSHCMIWPDRNPGARVGYKLFLGKAGEDFERISYKVDETVVVIEGCVCVTDESGVQTNISRFGAYEIAAGENYSARVVYDGTIAISIFSQAADGTLPPDEPDPQN